MSFLRSDHAIPTAAIICPIIGIAVKKAVPSTRTPNAALVAALPKVIFALVNKVSEFKLNSFILLLLN